MIPTILFMHNTFSYRKYLTFFMQHVPVTCLAMLVEGPGRGGEQLYQFRLGGEEGGREGGRGVGGGGERTGALAACQPWSPSCFRQAYFIFWTGT
jgi:hypothetical protein